MIISTDKNFRLVDFLFLVKAWLLFGLIEIAFTSLFGIKIDFRYIALGLGIYGLCGLIAGVLLITGTLCLSFHRTIHLNREKMYRLSTAFFIASTGYFYVHNLLINNDEFSSWAISALFAAFILGIGIYMIFPELIAIGNSQNVAYSFVLCTSIVINGTNQINNTFNSKGTTGFEIAINGLVILIAVVSVRSIILLFNKIFKMEKPGTIRTARLTGLGLIILCYFFILFGLVSSRRLTISRNSEETPVGDKIFDPNVRNILLITMDALRADHLSCYSHTGAVTPCIDSLASGGVLFKQAISQSPWTLPSFASLFTSCNPSIHGGGKQVERKKRRYTTELSPNTPTLAEILKKNGYKTAASVSNFYLSRRYGFGRGFEYFSNVDDNDIMSAQHLFWMRIFLDISEHKIEKESEKNRSNRITECALNWLDKHADNPFFLWIHYLDPHIPYEHFEESEIFHDTAFDTIQEKMRTLLEGDMWNILHQESFTLSSLEQRFIEILYDEEIKTTDRYIGELLQKLRSLNLEKTLIIFTSDHGEELFDRAQFGHGHSVYDEVIRVPFIICFPDRSPASLAIKEQVRMIDIMPTILELCNIPIDPETEGTSLMPLIRKNQIMMPPALSEFLYYEKELKCLRTDEYKLIYQPDNGKIQLFDLQRDAGECVDIHDRYPEETRNLLNILNEYLENIENVQQRLSPGRETQPQIVDRKMTKSLKSLGYIN